MRFFHPIWLLALMIAGCVGTEVGNPQDTSKVSVDLTAYERQIRGALTLANGIEIEQAWLVFEELSLRSAANCQESEDDDGEFEIEHAFAVELISGQQFPAIAPFDKQATEYCRLEMDLADADLSVLPEGVPAELAEMSILVRGKRDDGTPFTLRDDFNDTFRLDGPFSLEAGIEPLVVAFALDDWLSPAQLDEAEGDAQIVIDKDTNADLLDPFRDSVRRSAALFRDANGDGELQDDERDAPLATGVVDDS
jgi:hypothetical protein